MNMAIEIVDLAVRNVEFSITMSVYQRVNTTFDDPKLPKLKTRSLRSRGAPTKTPKRGDNTANLRWSSSDLPPFGGFTKPEHDF